MTLLNILNGLARGGRIPMSKMFNGSSGLGDALGLITTFVAIAALLRNILPAAWIRSWRRMTNRIANWWDPYLYVTIREFGSSPQPDQNYRHAKIYLSQLGSAAARKLVVAQPRNVSEPIFTPAENETIVDVYCGAQWQWVHHTKARSSTVIVEGSGSGDAEQLHHFQLCVHRCYRPLLPQYIKHVKARAEEQELRNRELQVFSNTGVSSEGKRGGRRMWEAQPFKHPASFDTLALGGELKTRVLKKLEEFQAGAEYYRRTGRAHKMGFLLYGPPGTGKTSFIAALANHLHFSIYDLDLSGVASNLDLRALLAQVSDRAVVVIEDIDTVELPNRTTQGVAAGGGGGEEEAWRRRRAARGCGAGGGCRLLRPRAGVGGGVPAWGPGPTLGPAAAAAAGVGGGRRRRRWSRRGGSPGARAVSADAGRRAQLCGRVAVMLRVGAHLCVHDQPSGAPGPRAAAARAHGHARAAVVLHGGGDTCAVQDVPGHQRPPAAGLGRRRRCRRAPAHPRRRDRASGHAPQRPHGGAQGAAAAAAGTGVLSSRCRRCPPLSPSFTQPLHP